MANYSKILELLNGIPRTIDLSTNTLVTQGLTLNAATGGGSITFAAHSTSSVYSVVWPASQAASSGYVLTNDGSGNLSWAVTSSPLVFTDSLVNTGGTVTLVNDSASPTASQYYGTNGSSVLGYYNLPVSGINQLTGDVTAGPGTGSQAASLVATSNATLTTLSALTTASSLATVGTISSGTWHGSIIGYTYGGTNAASQAAAQVNMSPMTTAGDLTFENATPAPDRLPIGSNGDVLTVVSGLPAWAPASVSPGSIALTDNHILVGNSSNLAADVAMSGDATIVASGALTLATVNSNVGSFGSSTSIPSFTVNAKGLITAASGNAVVAPAGTLTGTILASNVVTSSLTSLGIQSAALNMGSNQINNVADPTSPQDAATKNYVDTVASGLEPLQAVYAATIGSNIPGTYLNGVSGIGATFTTTSTATFTLDGTTPPLNSRILIKDQSTGFQNGVYNFTVLPVSSVSGAVFTRALDYDQASEMNSGALIPIINGTVNAPSGNPTLWIQTATITNVGTDSLTFIKFNQGGSGTVTSVGLTVPSFLNVSGSPITTSGTLAVSLSGTALPVANGGTSLTTLTANNVILGNGTGAPTFVAPGTTGNVLTSSAGSWVSAAPSNSSSLGMMGGITISNNAGSNAGNFSTTSTSLAAFSSPGAGTTTYTPVSGNTTATAPGSTVPGIKLASLPAGTYRITALGGFTRTNTASTGVHLFAFNDGTTTFGTQGYGNNSDNSWLFPNLVGYVTYASTQSNITIQLFARTNNGSIAVQIATGADDVGAGYVIPLQIYVERIF